VIRADGLSGSRIIRDGSAERIIGRDAGLGGSRIIREVVREQPRQVIVEQPRQVIVEQPRQVIREVVREEPRQVIIEQPRQVIREVEYIKEEPRCYPPQINEADLIKDDLYACQV